MPTQVTVEQWIAMFREVGLDDARMNMWHHIFECRNPEGHSSFLNWLGLSTEKIEEIRSKSR